MRARSLLSLVLTLALLLTVSSAEAARKKGKKAEPDETKGTLPKEKIIKVLKEHKDAIKSCYSVQQEMKPELEGSVTMRWKIYPEGEVQGVEVAEATLEDKDVQTCLKGEIASWTFQKPKGGVVTVTFPFQFRPPPPKPAEDETKLAEDVPAEDKPADKKSAKKGGDKGSKKADDAKPEPAPDKKADDKPKDKPEDKQDKGGQDDGINFGDGDLNNLFGDDKPAKKK